MSLKKNALFMFHSSHYNLVNVYSNCKLDWMKFKIHTTSHQLALKLFSYFCNHAVQSM